MLVEILAFFHLTLLNNTFTFLCNKKFYVINLASIFALMSQKQVAGTSKIKVSEQAVCISRF